MALHGAYIRAEVIRALKHTAFSTIKFSSLPKFLITWTLAPMGVEVSDAAIHYPFALFCRKEHPLRAAANLVDFSYGTELVKRVRFPGTQPADTP